MIVPKVSAVFVAPNPNISNASRGMLSKLNTTYH